MDPIKNPFAPGAGTRPPALVGRDALLNQAAVLFGRTLAGRTSKGIIMTGLRGVGKTVLLNEMRASAEAQGLYTLDAEASESKALGQSLSVPLKSVLFKLSRIAGAQDKIRRGLMVLRSFLGTLQANVDGVALSLGVEPEVGTADSGELESDLTDVLHAVAEAADDRNTAVAVLIDEAHCFNKAELGALITAMHRIQQRRLPLAMVAAGLPTIPALAGDAKSYAECLFDFPSVGVLGTHEAGLAIREPVENEGASITDPAVEAIVAITAGYPYFLQEWGAQAWNAADTSTITADDVKEATIAAQRSLDEGFFRVRFDRLTSREKVVARAMAQLGAGPYRPGEVAAALGIQVSSLSPSRAQLINKGMVYSPAHGSMAFTVPLFDEFMKRAMPEFNT